MNGIRFTPTGLSPQPSQTAAAPALTGTRATLLRRSRQHVEKAKRELLQVVNSPLMQRYIPGPAMDILDVESERPFLHLVSGFAHPLLPLLPENYHARYALARTLPLQAPLITTGLAITFTALAANFMGPIAIGIGVYFSVTEAVGLWRLARDKAHMNEVDDAASRVNELLGNIRDWSRRGEDAMDTRGANLQQIYEERRDRTRVHGLQSGLRMPAM